MTAQVRARASDAAMAKQGHQERSNASNAKQKRKRFSERSKTHTKAVNPIKSKIRDLTRLLQHSDRLPADIRIEKERALVGYKQDLETALRDKHRSQMISKYHMVRFFERQKAARNLKKLRSRLAAASPENIEQADLKLAVHRAEVDLNYTIYHPLDVKYLSLFPRNKPRESNVQVRSSHTDETLDPQAITQRSYFWGIVERCMQEDSLDGLREGKLSTRYSKVNTKMKLAKEQANQKHEAANAKAVKAVGHLLGDGMESDEGFFET